MRKVLEAHLEKNLYEGEARGLCCNTDELQDHPNDHKVYFPI